jgi:hypothetical protein
MIESCYWKDELARIARTVARVEKPPRWSERAHGVVERDLMIGFFLLRRLIELKKVSSAICDRKVRVFSYKSIGKRVTLMNSHRLDELYDMENEIAETKKPFYIANQFVHAYTSFVARDQSRNWSDVLVVSDYDRNDCIWRVPVETVRSLFLDASNDYPHEVRLKFDPSKGDYKVTTN